MTIEQLLQKLNIVDYPQLENGKLTIFLRDSNVYMKVYEKLENIDELDSDDIQLTDEFNIVTYHTDNFNVKLSANYNENLYTLEITEVK